VRGETVDAVEGKMLIEVGEAEEALKGRFAHVKHVAEAHVVFDEGNDLLGLFVGEVKAAKHDLGDANPYFDVTVEADAIVRVARIGCAEGCGLADVVKERSPGQSGRGTGREFFEEQHGVDPDVAFGVVLGRLLDAVEFADLGKDVGQEAERIEQLKARAGATFGEDHG
jgi:hypothetical protein